MGGSAENDWEVVAAIFDIVVLIFVDSHCHIILE